MLEEKEEKDNLIDVRVVRREFINKMLVFGILVIVVITLASIAGIIIARLYNEKKIANYYLQMQEVPEELQNEEEKIEDKKPLIPVYSENAKQKMSSIYTQETEEKTAYLTFDDGPSSNITPQILDTLQKEGVKATFFVLGSRVELNPEILKREYEEGHYIANHGYSHDYKRIYSSPNTVLDEYNHTERAIKEVLGIEEYSSHLFRFPGGSEGGKYAKIKNEAKILLEQNNIAHINWNSLTSDAVGHPTADSIINGLKSTVDGKNTVVVLMHDTGTKQLTADTLPEVIKYLREQGYSFKNFYDIMCE